MRRILKIGQSVILLLAVYALMPQSALFAQEDHSFYSHAFKSERWYRIYLPESYEKSPQKRYPVIYFFHGFGGRYKWQGNAIDFDAKQLARLGKKRTEPPLVMEWREYTQKHDVIIVTWDGYEPLYEPGLFERDGLRYGGCAPYDYLRAHEVNGKCRGWDFRPYFAELTANVDSLFRTIPDRAHRAVTGQSMGGLMSLYIGGQCKDLISSVSAFCPADNIPLFGPLGRQAVFPILEMWRSLVGMPVRLTYTDGDWLIYNDLELKRLWSNSDIKRFTFHEAHFPNHWAGDSDKQLDYHMKYFSKNLAIPENWSYVAPGFLSFNQFGYRAEIQREQVGLTLFNHINKHLLKIESRKFIPDGQIIMDEKVNIVSDLRYSSQTKIIAYNLSNRGFYTPKPQKSDDGKLSFQVNGGGNVIGINTNIDNGPKIRLTDRGNTQYYYFEEGREYHLDFNVINVGGEDAEDVKIRAYSDHPYLSIYEPETDIKRIGSGKAVVVKNGFKLKIKKYDIESSVGKISFEIKSSGAPADTQNIIFFTTAAAPYVGEKDVIILDGRSVENVPMFAQGKEKIVKTTLSGGKGNGDGILDRGEDALIYIRLKQGLAPEDTNTFHRTYLLNDRDYKDLTTELKYSEKILQAGATSIFTLLKVSKDAAPQTEFDLWFKVESLHNEHTPVSDRAVYAHRYDYRRLKLRIGSQ